ncbi:hypothetical protein [Streptomyces spongiae]|uniref:hypothetical protein n=1 Tax=Streptomyces spongiae TaxID=565072 RepID=UPI001883B8E6|nr:hypothetical protein [Streptomyces spongiae]
MRGGKNMVLTFEDTTIRGPVSASRTRHRVSTIDASKFQELGEVTNSAQAAVNNGVIVRLDSGSSWTVTGTSYLTGPAVVTPGRSRWWFSSGRGRRSKAALRLS